MKTITKTVYQCENCGKCHTYSSLISKCERCNDEICSECREYTDYKNNKNYKYICNKCYEKEIQEIVADINNKI